MHHPLLVPTFAIIVTLLACADVAELTGTPAFDCAQPPKERVALAPGELVAAFGSNVVHAEAKFGGGKLLELTGQASRISRDEHGAFVAMRSGPIGKGKVQAYFPDANAAAFEQVQEGQAITVLAYLEAGKSTEKRIPLYSACLVKP
ncbi:MAG: hypothetical protein EXR69_00865 [Myxococcales bacterium]|nr:hypothetical protein [Myxococcales bacterium]